MRLDDPRLLTVRDWAAVRRAALALRSGKDPRSVREALANHVKATAV